VPTLTPDRLERLIAGFARFVDEPSDELPSTRCISAKSVRALFARLRKEAEFKWLRDITNQVVTQSLQDASILVPLASPSPSAETPSDALYAVGLNPDPASLDPLEILTALEPQGIVCYFTAYVLHDLTTQIPSFHHVARLVNREVSDSPPPPRDRSDDVQAPRLGTLRFTFAGLQFYSTQRARQLVPGVQRRHVHSGLRIRCTTLEQALLDGVLRPVSCGGASVVLEGWERGIGTANVELLLHYAEAMDRPLLLPRIGYLLEQFAGPSSTTERLRQRVRATGDGSVGTLLPGMQFARVDTRWSLMVP
jgi:hypothetical protein